MQEEYLIEKMIKGKNDKEKELELMRSIIETKELLKVARCNFEYAEDELIDYYTYQIKAHQSKLDYLIKIAKRKGIVLSRINELMARLYRNPTVKTEISQKKALFGNSGESVTYGFVGYPVSQAADITAFRGQLIPTGDDQKPLVEQCREIVRKFNSIYGETLKEPEILLSNFPRIKGLDGNDKMGKSLGNAIYLKDDEKTINDKVMKAITDPSKIKKDDPANPDICMVYYYHKLFNKDKLETVCSECKKGSRGCVACKKELIQKINEHLKPIREKRKYYDEHPEIVDSILQEGTANAQKVAKEVIKEVKQKMKIDYFS